MWTRRLRLVLILFVASVVFLLQPDRDAKVRAFENAPAVQAQGSQLVFLPFVRGGTTTEPLWRFGVDLARQMFSAYNPLDVAQLRLGWFINFGVSPVTFGSMEYVPMVRMKQWKQQSDGTQTLCCVGCSYSDPPVYTINPSLSQIQSIAASKPGMTWIVGNEMERIDWGSLGGACGRQDEMLPEVYAQAYHEVYSALKSADPTAQVALGAMVQPSPLRLEYLDRVWAEYTKRYGTMQVDVWAVHIYVYNEQKGSWGADIPAGLTETSGTIRQVRDNKDFTLAAQMIVGWRTWMKDHGQQNKPLITPEYGSVMPDWLQDPPGTPTFLPSQVRDSFMYPSFDYFLNHTDPDLGFAFDGNRLVQRWAWWSLDYDDGTCDLTDNKFYADNGGNLFFSGLGPSWGSTSCPFPAKGLSQFGTFWTQYVGNLPSGKSKPYASVLSAAPSRQPAAPSAFLKYAPDSALCSDSPQARARLLKSLPSRSTPEGQQAWLTTLTKLTPGTRICLP